MTLKEWLASQGLEQKEGAALFGVAQSSLSRIIAGTQQASVTFALLVDRITEGAVRASSFFKDGACPSCGRFIDSPSK